ncbi:RagB/SusD family nutrient uptake outer membrane protein [Pedobacter frigidisoli]|uniref:RagB/SusD family nutrient uptake outer membrane protein n=1 Tax=Pedobacter frigidisoli TaxID=2530455 RepID=A0A4R0NZM8_9SPHI|nr:RagB/SusD family nutrient uptake outer membrane protein [Pedobacter frigidisoli]TCD05899.1 RagB/SusD family nutrient uptake outer membrane protein [Pedobacter frigidisoli]
MKNIKIFVAILALMAVFMGCQKQLIEDPKAILVPQNLSSPAGLQLALDASYAGARNLWGGQDYFFMTTLGTDEFARGGDANAAAANYTFTPTEGRVNTIWRNCYIYINSCNGVIDNAPSVDLAPTVRAQMIAEAKFLRANYYFSLVQSFGDVTLLKNFETVGSTSASRTPMAEVYAFMIQDLKDAIPILPASPKISATVLPGKATAAAGKHLLAKIYLTRAGSSAKQATDYQDAYNTANDLITTASSIGLGLQADFARVFAEGNEDNSEVLFSVQHTSNLAYNGPGAPSGATGDNMLNHLFIGYYERKPGMVRDVFYGRPFNRAVPTNWLLNTAFKDRVNDSRYGKSFQTVWIANNTVASGYPLWPNPLPAGAPASAIVGQAKFKAGDTAIYMPGVDITDAKIAATRYLVIPPRKYDNTLAPTLTKYFDSKRSTPDVVSIRPVIVYRLAETYLIAAEAAFMSGQTPRAVSLINAVRERAAANQANKTAMDIQASDVSLDFILEERSRELCGENMRWFDLVRTGKLIDRVKLYNTEAGANILPKHVLRPIPQSQIDAVSTGAPYPQNPGWQ